MTTRSPTNDRPLNRPSSAAASASPCTRDSTGDSAPAPRVVVTRAGPSVPATRTNVLHLSTQSMFQLTLQRGDGHSAYDRVLHQAQTQSGELGRFPDASCASSNPRRG